MPAHHLQLPAALAAAIALTGPLSAQQLYLDDAAACDRVLISQDGINDDANQGGLILGSTGFNSMEYFCSFEPDLQYHWDGYQVTTHVRHCQTPGPVFMPTVFTFVMTEEAPGEIALFDSNEYTTRFYSCTD